MHLRAFSLPTPALVASAGCSCRSLHRFPAPVPSTQAPGPRGCLLSRRLLAPAGRGRPASTRRAAPLRRAKSLRKGPHFLDAAAILGPRTDVANRPRLPVTVRPGLDRAPPRPQAFSGKLKPVRKTRGPGCSPRASEPTMRGSPRLGATRNWGPSPRPPSPKDRTGVGAATGPRVSSPAQGGPACRALGGLTAGRWTPGGRSGGQPAAGMSPPGPDAAARARFPGGMIIDNDDGPGYRGH